MWKHQSPAESEEDDVHKEQMSPIGWVPILTPNMSQCSKYVCLGGKVNMMSDLAWELGRRRGAYGSISDVEKMTRNTQHRDHISETWTSRKKDENAVSTSNAMWRK